MHKHLLFFHKPEWHLKGMPINELNGLVVCPRAPGQRVSLRSALAKQRAVAEGDVDDAGVQFSNGSLLAVINANGTYGLSATGSASLVGVSGLSLTGTLTGERNTTGAAISEDLTVGGVTQTRDDLGHVLPRPVAHRRHS